MRREIEQNDLLLNSSSSLEDRIAHDHPLRGIRYLADEALSRMQVQGPSSGIYPHWNETAIPPERLIRATLLQVLYSVRCEVKLTEQLQYNLLFRWFVGLSEHESVWGASAFSHDRDSLLESETTAWLLSAVIASARAMSMIRDGHFVVDTMLLQSWITRRNVRVQSGNEASGNAGRCTETRDTGRYDASSPARIEPLRSAASPPASTIRPAVSSKEMLSGRQVEVLRALSNGKTNKLIARELGITEGTVKIHLASIFRALNVQNRTEAAIVARNLSIV